MGIDFLLKCQEGNNSGQPLPGRSASLRLSSWRMSQPENLDAENANEVVMLMSKAARLYNQTIIMVTHDRQMADMQTGF